MKDLEMIVPDKALGLSSPSKLAEFATTLKTFIVKEGLFSEIQGKNYVNVEGWQFAGATAGVFPIIKLVQKLEPTSEKVAEIRYRAEVQLETATGRVVGYGVAVCSSKEPKRQNADEYVIASMAQTRAIGKAYRNIFAWLMKIAGYEPTPAEEMEEHTIPVVKAEDNGKPATPGQIKTIKTLSKAKKVEVDTEGLTQGKAVEAIRSLIKEMKNGK